MKSLTLILTLFTIAAFSHATPTLLTRSQSPMSQYSMLNHTQQQQHINNKTGLLSGSCIYKINIKTSCNSPRLTTDAIDILIGDADRNQIISSPDPNTGLFKRCSTNTFLVHGDCIGKICSLIFVRVGTDGWMPESATVYYRDYPHITFNFDSFIPLGVPSGLDYCNKSILGT